jgi:putative oxidoreductase
LGGTRLRNILGLDFLARYSDHSLALLRLLTGAFLMHGTLDNIVSVARMEEFEHFLAANGFPWPHLAAPLSVYAQFLCGLAFVLGLMTRWAGVIMVINFIIAVAMVHLGQEFRAQWPALVLVFISLHFAVHGAGRFSIDKLLEARWSKATWLPPDQTRAA